MTIVPIGGPISPYASAPARSTGVSAWLDIVKPAAELAQQIALTEFVPKSFREDRNGRAYEAEAVVAKVTACILFGAEVGIGPMQALAKIAIIDGRPAPAAELARALLLSEGHDMWVVEASTTRVVMAGKRANSAHTQQVTWTMDDAKKAGLAGKQNWQRYPRQMLLARASVELARMVAPDALGGISVFVEELDAPLPDAPPSSAAAAEAKPKAQVRKLAAAPPAPAEAPPLPSEEPLPAAEAPPLPEPPPAPPAPPLPGEDEQDDPAEALEREREEAVELALASEPKGYDAPLSREEREAITAPQAGAAEEPPGPSGAQLRKLMATYNGLGIKDRADQKRATAALLDIDGFTSHNDLTAAQASMLIDMLSALDPFNDVASDADGHRYIIGSEPPV